MTDGPQLLTVREVCRRLRVSRGYVYRLIAEGKLPSLRLGPKAIRIAAEDFAAWLADRRHHPIEHGKERVS